MLSKQIKKHAPDLKIAYRPPEKIASIFSDMKQKLEDGQCSCVVYNIPCKDCRNRSYVGETKVRLDDREKGHKTDIKNVAKAPTRTALVNHIHKTGHTFDFEKKEILKKVRSQRTLKIHEANQIILKGKAAINSKKDAEHVSPVFYNLIKNSVKRTQVNHPKRQQQMVSLKQMFDQNV